LPIFLLVSGRSFQQYYNVIMNRINPSVIDKHALFTSGSRA
jgi:hypothetical protein